MVMTPKSGSVLCVDDEPSILRSLHWMLHKEFNVMTAPDGPTALEMLRKHDFDVIVSDQRMPGMIGSEFLHHACKLAPRAMRILLTGYSDMQAILRSINEGEVFRFVNKPWSNEELSRTVREAAVIARTQPVPSPSVAAGDTRGERILLLDEDAQMLGLLRKVVSPGTELCHATTLSDAVSVLDAAPVSVLVSETRLGRVDTTPLLKLLKQSRPEIVSIVLSVDSDVDAVVKLINQGQVYRFVPKPVKAGFLKIMLASAVHKHQELKKVPAIAQRHAVERSPQDLRQKLELAIAGEAQRAPLSAAVGTASFLDRVSGSLRRLFSAA